MTPSLVERFWSHVDATGDCWVWTGSCNKKGYGQGWDGQSPRLAHRLSWSLSFGPIPNGALVLHRCDNPPCVNPAHLWLDSASDNSRDMAQKNRWRNGGLRGEEVGNAVLTNREAWAIRVLGEGLGHKGQPKGIAPQLAVLFDTNQTTVKRIVSGRAWKHVA